jgi:hypothetical protein
MASFLGEELEGEECGEPREGTHEGKLTDGPFP